MIRALPIVLLCCTALAQSAPRLLVDVNTEPVVPSSSNPYNFARFGAWVFFSADDGVHGRELFRTNGMAATTGLFADLRPGPDGSDPRDLVQVGTRLFFTADDGVHGRELWVSDGTAAGTRMVVDLRVGPVGSEISKVLAFGNSLVFSARDDLGVGLVSSDGTPGGTVRLVDGVRTANWNEITAIHAGQLGGQARLLFLVLTAQGQELWRSDGTAPGTFFVTRHPGWTGNARARVAMGGSFALVFTQTLRAGEAVLRTDGTAAGTSAVYVARSVVRFGGGGGLPDSVIDGQIWISGTSGPYSLFALVSDGTTAGTYEIPQTSFGAESWIGDAIGEFDGATWTIGAVGGEPRLFRFEHGSSGPVDMGVPALVPSARRFGRDLLFGWREGALWSFDPVRNVAARLGPAAAYVIGEGLGRAFFVWRDPVRGDEPGVTDGTPAGTALLVDLNTQPAPTSASSSISIVDWDLQTVLRVQTPQGSSLWLSDGTTAGTRRFAHTLQDPNFVAALGERLVIGSGPSSQPSFHLSDGTNPGTMSLPPPGNPGEVVLWLRSASLGDEYVVFVDHAQGKFLRGWAGSRWTWRVDLPPVGTPTVVRFGDEICFTVIDRTTGASEVGFVGRSGRGFRRMPVREFAWGDGGYHLTPVVFQDKVWFACRNGLDQELWCSDGTLAGTRMVTTIARDPIRGMAATATTLFVATGWELFASDGTPAGTRRLPVTLDHGRVQPIPMFASGGQVLVPARDANGVMRIWRSDGTPTGTTPLRLDLQLEAHSPWVPAGEGRMFLPVVANGGLGTEIWFTDGSAAGTRLVARGDPGEWFRRSNGIAGVSNGRLLVLAIDPFASFEPHVIDLGATVERLSEGCGVGARRAELYAALGGSPNGGLSIEGRSSIGSVAQIVLSAPPMHPLAFPQNGACTLDVDPNAWVLLASLPIANQRFAQSWSLPDDPALYGLQVVVQGFVGPTNAPLGADFTNGLLLSLGQ